MELIILLHYYPKEAKQSNIENSLKNRNYIFKNLDFNDLNSKLDFEIDIIIHFGVKAGVRPSIENLVAYQIANVIGTQNVLELARSNKTKKVIFASSSSVYVINQNYPWIESTVDLMSISPYAQIKLWGEFLGSVYSYLFGI